MRTDGVSKGQAHVEIVQMSSKFAKEMVLADGNSLDMPYT